MGELTQLEKKNKKKIESYMKTQKPLLNKDNRERNKREPKLSPVPKNLSAYKDLSAFGPPSDLPKKEKLKGVYICDPNICLSDEELRVLERDPKYSLMLQVDRVEFDTELERMMWKDRYNDIAVEIEIKKNKKKDFTQY